MIYTKEQLQGMSDFERNKVLANLVGLKISKEQYLEYGDRDERCVIVDIHSVGDKVIDYCNNPSDIMPLAFEHKIALTPHSGITDTWVAQYYFDAVGVNSVINDNPLRAIACCLTLVLQEKQNEQTNN